MMKPTGILIVGQGLAGTVLGWTLTRAGIDWRMTDAGHDSAASRVAAGIINPVTGQRWVKTWRIEELWPETRDDYQEMGRDLGVTLWRELKIRRFWRTDKEKRVLLAKCERGVLEPYVTSIDTQSCLLSPAAQVDLPTMLAAARERWLAEGRLTEGHADWREIMEQYPLVIDCTGAASREGPFAAWQFAISKGEVLRAQVQGLDAGMILHRGHWLLPVEKGDAWIGATHEPGVADVTPTDVARDSLLASAHRLTDGKITPMAHLVGLRLAARDMKPVVGRHPEKFGLGILSALGSKGVLYAPWLARQWVEHLLHNTSFDPDVDISRVDAGRAD